MRRLGQHFLKNSSAIKKIVQALDLKEKEIVIEIGPGHGELTIPLAIQCKTSGCRIIAIEKDDSLGDALAAMSEKEESLRGLHLEKGDALKILPSLIDGIGAENYKIAGNIPYYITGKLLRIIGDLQRKPDLVIFTIQKEVAERICAIPPNMNRLAASIQVWADPKIIASVPRSDFFPAPEVDSATIVLKKRSFDPLIETDKYDAALKAIFAQPRKTILNNVATATSKKKEDLIAIFTEMGLRPEIRPQDLSIKDIALIGRRIF